ncbi:hypothetical protein RQP46_006352 [Phenoliferia psychrophenolica]
MLADLALQLGKLTIRQFLQGTPSDNIALEAQQILDAKGQPTRMYPLDNAPPPATSGSATSNVSTVHEILRRLPSKRLADASALHYFQYIDLYIHSATQHIFDFHSEAVWLASGTGSQVDPFSLALVLAVWGVGLSAQQDPVIKDDKAKEMLDLSKSALTIGRYLERPSLDSIRALLILAVHYLALSDGEEGGEGVQLLAVAVQSCLQLNLHRDPTKLKAHCSNEEAEDRRRLFWLTFLVEHSTSSATGKTLTFLPSSRIDTKLPLDVPDERMGALGVNSSQETVMTALIFRIQIAQLAERITDVAFGIKSVAYSSILELDHQLDMLEAAVPAFYKLDQASGPDAYQNLVRNLRTYMIYLAIYQERLRLHRPYLIRSYSDGAFAYSCDMSIKTSHQIVAMHARLCSAPRAGLTFKVIGCAIVLMIHLLHDPSDPEAPQHRQAVYDTLHRIEKFSKISSICRHGRKVLRFLLNREQQPSASYPYNSTPSNELGAIDYSSLLGLHSNTPPLHALSIPTFQAPDWNNQASFDPQYSFPSTYPFYQTLPAPDASVMPYGEAAPAPLFTFGQDASYYSGGSEDSYYLGSGSDQGSYL